MLTSRTVTLKQRPPPAFVYVARSLLMVMKSPSSLGKLSRRLLRETAPTGSATSAAVRLTAHKEVRKYFILMSNQSPLHYCQSPEAVTDVYMEEFYALLILTKFLPFGEKM